MSGDRRAQSTAGTARLAATCFAVGGVLYVADILVVNRHDLALATVFGAVPWILFTIAATYTILHQHPAFLRLLVAVLTLALAGGIWLGVSTWTNGPVRSDVISSHAFLVAAAFAWLVSYAFLVHLVSRKTPGHPTVPNRDPAK